MKLVFYSCVFYDAFDVLSYYLPIITLLSPYYLPIISLLFPYYLLIISLLSPYYLHTLRSSPSPYS